MYIDHFFLQCYVCSAIFEKTKGGIDMTIAEKIKSLRNLNGMTQESLAETLNVSRSAIAKWENNNGVPEISNLKLISQIFNVSLDDILDDELCINASEDGKREEKTEIVQLEYAGWNCSIDLVGWNDGVQDVLILSEDKDFLFYQKAEKNRVVYGMLGKKYITNVKKESRCDTLADCDNINRDYFCNKDVFIDIACKKGLIKGFFDFESDDYRNVVISSFENTKIVLYLGREIDICSIAKIEEL
jgi:transcriptional regulator with XRE-family HTH domain